jgi:hypothetical protein
VYSATTAVTKATHATQSAPPSGKGGVPTAEPLTIGTDEEHARAGTRSVPASVLQMWVAVGKSRSRKRAARLRRCTSEPPCTTSSRRTACARRTRWPFSEPTLTSDPAGSPGVFPTATWKTRSAAPGNGGSLGGAVDDLIAEYLENEDAQRLFQLLVAADDPQLGPILFRLKDCRLPLPRQVLEGVGIE